MEISTHTNPNFKICMHYSICINTQFVSSNKHHLKYSESRKKRTLMKITSSVKAETKAGLRGD